MTLITAAFALYNNSDLQQGINQNHILISFASGSKCLPYTSLPTDGNALHDSHAEVLARRGAIRWFMQEIQRISSGFSSPWLECHPNRRHRFRLAASVSVVLYVSNVPCGDASMALLANAQDAKMKELKDSCSRPARVPPVARGRDNYSLISVLRTKPGRTDSPPTTSLSCSDKIAKWSVLGFQGALLSRILDPVYVDHIVIDATSIPEDIKVLVQSDCERAFGSRISSVVAQCPLVSFQKCPFAPPVACPSSPHEALSWVAGIPPLWDITVRGYKRGVPLCQRSLPRSSPLLCKRALFRLWLDFTSLYFPEEVVLSYFDAKQIADSYNSQKQALIGPGCPFEGWIVTGRDYENFGLERDSKITSL